MNEKSSSNTSNIRAQVIENRVVDPISVLHVDDEEIFLQATKIYLEESTGGKVKVDSLINPDQVVRKLQEKTYDVIVADYRMTPTDGLQLLKQLQDQNLTLPFIMFTGRGREDVAIQALNLGVNRYIKKGMDTESQFGELLHTVQEVVHQKRTRETLQESEKKYRDLISNLTDAVVEMDSEGFFTFVSPQGFDLLGYRPEEVIGKNSFEFIHPDDHETAMEALVKVLKGDQVFNYEYRARHKAGHYVSLSASGKIVVEADDLKLVTIIKDITERKQAEKALKASENRFRELVDTSPDAIVLTDLLGDIVIINKQGTKIFGCKDGYELINTNIFELIAPEDQEPALRDMKKTIKSGKGKTHEYTALRKDRTLFSAEMNTTMIYDEVGSPNYFLATIRDITERKRAEKALQESEERFRLLGENITVGLSIIQEDQFVYGNDSFFEIISFPKEEILGCKPSELNKRQVYPEDLAFVQEQFQKKLSEEKDGLVPRYQYRWYTKNNLLKWIEVISKPTVYQGKPAILGAIIDITTQKHTENEILLVNKELQDFASIIAHDLKTPLRNLKTLAGWLLRDSADDLNEEGKDHLASLIKQTTHMDALIDGIWQYSRIDRFHKEIVKINQNDLLSEIIDVLSPPDNIKINIQAELPHLAVDRIHITQIFSNLIENAIKFMDKPKGQININCEDKKSLWQFSVADTGPGIEESHFERIFQMFQTLSPWDESKGTGIGLAIVKKIVELNGGKVWLESAVGKGSTFFFTLPKG